MNILDACQLKIGYRNAPLVYIPRLTIHQGALIPLIGENGCGKTTLLLTLARQIQPLSGQLTPPLGKREGLKWKDILFLPSNPTFFEKLTLREHLELTGVLSNRSINPNPILKAFDLWPFRDCPTFKLSAGQRKCLALACITIKRPKLLLLDEPSAELDQVHRQLLHRTLYDLCQKGSTCLFSTHHAEDVMLYNHALKIESKILSWHDIRIKHNEDSSLEALTTNQA